MATAIFDVKFFLREVLHVNLAFNQANGSGPSPAHRARRKETDLPTDSPRMPQAGTGGAGVGDKGCACGDR